MAGASPLLKSACTVVAGLLLALASPAAPAKNVARASFDCGKASSRVEMLICADPELGQMDAALALAYKAAVLRGHARVILRSTQVAWLKKRDACADSKCVHAAYESRLAELRKDAAEYGDLSAAIIASCASLAAAADSNDTDCRVTGSGNFGKVGDEQQEYATYCLDAPSESGHSCDLTAIALFSVDPRTGKARRWLQRADSDGLGNEFGKPELLQLKDVLLLDLPVTVPGTGGNSASSLFRREGDHWVEIDITSWEKDLAARLPKGLSVWKGIWPDYRKMTATTGLYRPKDANCCPTGGEADILLRLQGNRLALVDVKFGPTHR